MVVALSFAWSLMLILRGRFDCRCAVDGWHPGKGRCIAWVWGLEMRLSRRGRARRDYDVSEWCENLARDSEVWRNRVVMLRVGWRAREVGRDYRW
jgi:hypothetical protein